MLKQGIITDTKGSIVSDTWNSWPQTQAARFFRRDSMQEAGFDLYSDCSWGGRLAGPPVILLSNLLQVTTNTLSETLPIPSTENQSPGFKSLPPRLQPDLSQVPLELRLVISILAHGSQTEDSQFLDCKSAETADWDVFLEWVERHKVGPQVLAALSQRDERLVPEHVVERLRRQCRQSAMASLVLAARTVELIDFLQGRGIRSLPVKGVCTAQQFYGAVEARPPGDIDLIVAPEDAEHADGLLRSLGYQCADLTFEVTRLQKEKLLRWAHSMEYFHPNARTRLDVHWRLFAYSSLLSIDFDTLWNQGEIVDLAGQKVRTLCPGHALLHSAAHGASHAWCHLIWLCDLAQFLRCNRIANWNAIVAEANRLGVIRHLAQGLVLAHALLGSSIPEQAVPCIVTQPVLGSLSAHSLTRLTSRSPDPESFSGSLRQILYLLKLSDRLRYKWEILTHVGLHPPDWKTVAVPDVLFPLYYILRPFIWLGRSSGRTKGNVP